MGIFERDKEKGKNREHIRSKSVEMTGKTVEKALEKGLKTLRVRIDEVEDQDNEPSKRAFSVYSACATRRFA